MMMVPQGMAPNAPQDKPRLVQDRVGHAFSTVRGMEMGCPLIVAHQRDCMMGRSQREMAASPSRKSEGQTEFGLQTKSFLPLRYSSFQSLNRSGVL